MPEQKGLVAGNPATNSKGHHNRSYSSFPESLSYRFAQTLRFGEYTPSFVFDGVPSDEIQLNSHDQIDSLSLNAPFKGEIRKIKESFMVPDMAILPMNWDRIYAQPSNGEDVPDDANCVLQDFPSKMSHFWRSCFSYFVGTAADQIETVGNSGILTYISRLMVLGEYIYSNGSLLKYCGYSASAQFRFYHLSPDSDSYDTWFDAVCTRIFGKVKFFTANVPVGDSVKKYNFVGLAASDAEVIESVNYFSSFRHFLEMLRENPLISISDCVVDAGFAQALADELAGDLGVFNSDNLAFVLPEDGSGSDPKVNRKTGEVASVDSVRSFDVDPNPNVLNLKRILAYQLVCAHYYSNSGIDFIYTAELYRQYISSLFEARANDFFVQNGITIQYDYLSGHCLSVALGLQYDDDTLSAIFEDFYLSFDNTVPNLRPLAVYAAIFGFRKSLRFGDYFVGARTRPLAPINTDVAVENNMVSVVNITKNIQAQRFANAVMRSRSKIEEYVDSLFGRRPAPDFHNPFYLTRNVEYVFGDEVQNTAEAQVVSSNSRTANFAVRAGRYTFTFHNDDAHPCTYLQIISFDIRRFYTRSVDRQMLQLNRYDMFNPDFQYIGDQPVYGIELGYPSGEVTGSIEDPDPKVLPDVISYQGRDMEYKASFDKAVGGFVENLPGWILTDRDRTHNENAFIDSDFIRSYNTELDQFYLSLTGYSLGNYFHFLNVCTNLVNAKRPMAVDPQILA